MINFLKSKWVQIIAWCCLFIGIVILFVTGTTQDIITEAQCLVVAIVQSIGALVAFIASIFDKGESA